MSESEPRPRLPYWQERTEVRISLMVTLPGHRPVFLEGLKLSVDRYFYERYSELGELDKWLHHQVVEYVMQNSTANRVALEVP